MCGIVGIVSAYQNGFSLNEADMFRDMLVVNTLRGFDSTGVLGVSNRGNMDVYKAAINGASFVETHEFKTFKQDAISMGLFAFGHNRAATRGSVTDANAHPFYIKDKIVLMQNGTYKGSHKHHKDTEVDTEAIAHVIADEPDIEKALQKINAAYALVWYDLRDKSINIIRNDERPLYIGYTKDGTIMFASEEETILHATKRNSVVLKDAPYLIDSNYLIKYTIDKDRSYDIEYKEKLDVKYRFQHTPATNHNDEEWSEDMWMGRMLPHYRQQQQQVHHKPAQASNQEVIEAMQPRRDMAKEVNIDIRTLVKYPSVLKNYFIPYADLDEITAKWLNHDKTKRVMVELLDYEAANTHFNCKTWYVYGSVVSIDGNEISPMAYSIIFNKNEGDMLEMCAGKENLYMVSVINNTNFAAMHNDKNGAVPTLYVTNFDKVPVLTTETDVQ